MSNIIILTNNKVAEGTVTVSPTLPERLTDQVYHADAYVLFEWLRYHLPGGTFDRLERHFADIK